MYRANHHPDFDLNPHLMLFMQRHPVLACMSRQIRKVCSRDLPTAGVSYDTRRNEVVLWWNDFFMRSLTVSRVHGILKHEFYHVVLRHLTARRRLPAWFWNCAADMAIDYLIWREAEAEANVTPGGLFEPHLFPLPEFAKTPGRFPWLFCPLTYRERDLHRTEHDAKAIPFKKNDDDELICDFDADPDTFLHREPTEQECKAYAFAAAIKNAPLNMSSEWYFNYLIDLFPEPGDGDGVGDQDGDGNDAGDGEGKGKSRPGKGGGNRLGDGSGSLDEHTNWDDIPDELREKAENMIRSMVERAVKEADSTSNGWGYMPSEVCADIRRSVSTVIDWKNVLTNFVGTIARGSSRRSIRVRDRRYGLLQPGEIIGHAAHLVVVIDQSGSVSSEMLEEFFAELESGTRKLSVTILPFDAACNVEEAWEWKRGTRPELKRTRSGGTDFDAPTDVINEHAQSRGWEGAVFMTDGQCSKPGPCNVRRLWIIGRGCGVPGWLDGEIAVTMDDATPRDVAVR